MAEDYEQQIEGVPDRLPLINPPVINLIGANPAAINLIGANLPALPETKYTGTILFDSVYPKWSNKHEFARLADYKYLSLVLGKRVNTFDHNFNSVYHSPAKYYGINKDYYLSGVSKHFEINMRFDPYSIPWVDSGPWARAVRERLFDRNYIIHNDQFFTSSSSSLDMISIYIIGVIAGWLHSNIDRVLPYDYIIVIDHGEADTRFKFITLGEKKIKPKRFFLNWTRFIINV